VTQLLARWNALGARSRALTVFAGFALAACAAFATLLARDTRVALFAAPLAPEQVAEVVERLAAWNVPFITLADNVRVEERRRNDVLLRLSLAGVPRAHVVTSAEALAKANPLTPQSVLEAQQREGLAGDVAGGIRGIAGVADARVIIAPATTGTYADEGAHEATASVRLSLASGASLPRATLDGIRQFVAAGVPGLEPKRVAILDDRGLGLTAGNDGDAATDARGYETSLQSALDLAFGTGATIVRVRVAYDPRERASREVERKPLGSRPIGAISNDETYRSSVKTYAKRSESIDRGSDVREERVDTPGGRVERISVGIALDAARGLDARQIRSLAIGTLGLTPARGDAVSVETVRFARHEPSSPPAMAVMAGFLATVLPAAFVALALAVAMHVGAKPLAASCEALVRSIALRRATRNVAVLAPSQVRGALRDEPPHTAAAIISALPAATATAVLEMYPAEERAAIVRRMSRVASPAVPDYETVLRRG